MQSTEKIGKLKKEGKEYRIIGEVFYLKIPDGLLKSKLAMKAEKVIELFQNCETELEKAKVAFEFVRDEISHSWDIQSTRITRKASEVLMFKEGICYAKSNLLQHCFVR